MRRAVLVDEVVHLLADDVGGLADPQEHLEVLEDAAAPPRRSRPRLRCRAKDSHERPTAARIPGGSTSRMPVSVWKRSFWRSEAAVGHGVPTYRSDSSARNREPRRRPCGRAGRGLDVSG